jgi:hypothetical protein
MKEIFYGEDKGKWAGKVNQKAVQIETDQKFVVGDIHPKHPELRFLHYRTEKRGRTICQGSGKKLNKTDPRYIEPHTIVTQRWQSLEDFEKNMAKRKEVQRVKRGYYNKESTKARESRIDQKALQVKDTGFKTYDPHPFVEGFIFVCYREDQRKTQRWMRGNKNDRGWQSCARVLQENLQTGSKIGSLKRGTIHPKNKKYVFVQYILLDGRWANKQNAVFANGRWYRKDNVERWETLEKFSEMNKRIHEYTKRKQEERNQALLSFYKSNKIPKYLWHKEEFAIEKDLQKALEHIIVKKYGLSIVHEMYTKQGRFDIYIKELDLIVEVKLTSKMWDIEKVAEQKARYEKIAETIVVSLDGEPEGWVTPKELFQVIESRI